MPIPRVSHVFVEIGLVYKLVAMQNKITVSSILKSRRMHGIH